MRVVRPLLGLLIAGGFVFWAIPVVKPEGPYARLLLDGKRRPLVGRVAADEQWRFPPNSIPEKYRQALLCYEDRRFYRHPGVDFWAVGRAMLANLRHGRVVSGASTLTMQTVRLARAHPNRHVGDKLLEMLLALKLDWVASKAEILDLYAAHAPYGGNVVGLEAAAWRYFGREAQTLSWAEAATLAVLPQSPALAHLARGRSVLETKRNRLLRRLSERGQLSETDLRLALAEPLIAPPRPWHSGAFHLMRGPGVQPSSIARSAQRQLEAALCDGLARAGPHVGNAAGLVLREGEPIAYVGNAGQVARAVDVARAPRSTGSILKPMLYALALDAGDITPHQLIPDIPTHLGGFHPENYDRRYRGAVPAREALARSLNVPAVLQLRRFGVARFLDALPRFGLTTFTRPAQHYGLSLILGGGEARLDELARSYDHLRRRAQGLEPKSPISRGAAYLTARALLEVQRPGVRSWLPSHRRISWKTGTSHGFRDAWAIGFSRRYTVAVWVGNADGRGASELTGSKAAAPILFRVFDGLDVHAIPEPTAELEQVPLCAHSGHRAGSSCPRSRLGLKPRGVELNVCPYCQTISCNEDCSSRVHAGCTALGDIHRRKWFVLPPAMEGWRARYDASYRRLPRLREDCDNEPARALSILYPEASARITLPRQLDGQRGRAVFKAIHRVAHVEVFWHLDDHYLGSTRGIHELPLAPEPGAHELVLVDERGDRVTRRFEVVARWHQP